MSTCSEWVYIQVEMLLPDGIDGLFEDFGPKCLFSKANYDKWVDFIVCSQELSFPWQALSGHD